MKYFVIPDCQIRPGVSTDFLSRIGKYIVDKRPDTIVCLGDFADMSSLSSYNVGKKSFEGMRYKADINSSISAMTKLLLPLYALQNNLKSNKKKSYSPRLVMCLGNHENRINRAVDDDPKLDGVLSTDNLKYAEFGWEVHPFLDIVILDGIAFSHYFVTGIAGRPSSSARAQLLATNMSSIAGHQQGLQIATAKKADGTMITSIITGSCYEHSEEYLGPQGNHHWRGLLVLHNVNNGAFDMMPVSLDYLKKKYP